MYPVANSLLLLSFPSPFATPRPSPDGLASPVCSAASKPWLTHIARTTTLATTTSPILRLSTRPIQTWAWDDLAPEVHRHITNRTLEALGQEVLDLDMDLDLDLDRDSTRLINSLVPTLTSTCPSLHSWPNPVSTTVQDLLHHTHPTTTALDLINDQDPHLTPLAPIIMDMDTDMVQDMVNMVPVTLATEDRDRDQAALQVMDLEAREDSPKDTHPNRTLDMHLHLHTLCPRP